MTDISLVMLHYGLKHRKFMLELSKAVKPQYFEQPYAELYGILQAGLANPTINDIMSPAAITDYCSRFSLVHKVEVLLQVYKQAVGLTIGGTQPSDSDFGYFLSIFKERYNSAVVQSAIKQMGTMLTSGIAIKDANTILENTLNEVKSINKSQNFDEGSLGEDIVNMYNEYKEIAANPGGFRGILSGFPSLDAITNGFNPGQLIVVAGFEGSGKSLLSMNFAVNAWLGSNNPLADSVEFVPDGKNVIYFSLEMPRSNKGEVSSAPNFNKRLISCLAKIPDEEFRRGILPDEKLADFKKVCGFIKKYDKLKKLYVIDMPRGATVEDIEVKYLELKEKFHIDMVIVDYIGLMAGVEDDSDWEAQGKAAEGLHEFARVYRIPVITPVQMTRPSGANHSLNKQNYNNTRVSRSKMITENANIVMMIESRDNELMFPDMPIHITKNRDGRTGGLVLMKDFPHMKIYDPLLAPETQTVERFVDLGDDE